MPRWSALIGCVAAAIFWLNFSPLSAQQERAPVYESPSAYLVTYGPGPIYWQRFGHNALWIRDPERGIDTQVNFGYFDFEQENFLLRFVQGRMEYFVATLEPESQFAEYQRENRSIRLQQLNLTPTEIQRLVDDLQFQLRPENRSYRYDYYFNNCSTKVRDMIDQALAGELRDMAEARSSGKSFRDETRRLTVMDPWYYLGLQTGLGQRVNQDMNLWEAFFLPGWLADGLSQLKREDGSPLVLSDRMLFEGGFQPPPNLEAKPWRYFLWGLIPTAIVLILGLILRRRILGVSLWLGLCSIVGLTLAGLWFLTDHEAAYRNASLLLFNPLFLPALLLLIPKTSRRWAVISLGVLLGGGLLISGLNLWLQLWTPSGPEVLIFVLPAHLLGFLWLLAWLRQPR